MPTQGVKEKSGWDSAAHFAVATGKRAAAFGSKARQVLGRVQSVESATPRAKKADAKRLKKKPTTAEV